MVYNFHGEPNPVELNQTDPTYPFHRRRLGYGVYDRYYDTDYTAPRGCCGMPFSFWMFLFGIFCPLLWIFGICCLGSRNPYERVWARASIFGLLFYFLLAIIFGSIYGYRSYYYY